MVIALSAYEKRSLARFLLIYLGSIYAFICLLAWMFYTIEIKNLHENYALKMRATASNIAHKIVTAHMMEDDTLQKCLAGKPAEQCFGLEKEYQLGLFGENNTPLHVSFSEPVDFTKTFYFANDSFYARDESSQEHLGIHTIVLKYAHISSAINALRWHVLLYLSLSLAFATVLGYVLAKQFLKPIQEEIHHLDTFIKDSTHELNTPITAILMSIGTLKNVDEKKLKRIELSAKRIATLYGNLSYMLLHDKQNEDKSDVDVKKLIAQRLEYFADLMASKQIDLSLKLEEKSLHVNEESLIKLIDNLLSNAIKYNRLGGTIEVSLNAEKLSVKDNGIGIASSKLGDITKRYKRANSDKGGFGIGLDIANSICKTNDFRLEISSIEGEGSTFSVFF
ncbi:sensor histidine kinase [Sulfurospirillum multivorans]|uniref:histidine kinase n=2 Tax=Sulfurospirillum multivorans TaxID=66821 RepID=A0AA86E3Y9_SULMK|nr:HAMP domain-containing sensor histidine kinase [Sulfurospirillum multivorans]AHJ14307.1 two-component system histidine kinase [Sulfurospirillum multivorans DSM 12446]QEH07793.1 two-component system histidine kinase [Sulfurospirillum multivorans]